MNTALATAHDEKGSRGVPAAMRTAESRASKDEESVRKCLVTGETKPKESLIRFVVDPSGNVVPDVAERLPGRGLWVSADAGALNQAVAKKLFARAARKPVFIASDLLRQVQNLLSRRCCDVLGLVRKAGAAVVGQNPIEEELHKGRLAWALVSADAGSDVLKKLGSAEIVRCGFSADFLGQALGRGRTPAVGLRPHRLTALLRKELARRQGVGEAGDFVNNEAMNGGKT